MHYKPSFFGGYESEADGEEFFFHKKGKEFPKLELIANLEAFYSSTSEQGSDKSPHCLFPARASFFKRLKLISPSQTAETCPKYERFQRKISAKSVSIVFSSYFLDTPASAFGHTLMRLNKEIRTTDEDDRNYELLDYAVNYSASVTTSNPFLYGLMGMIGGFKGEFAAIPYFYKVREYNDYESRDLWSYDLNLTQNEVDMVVAHIWEMGQTYFRYYYLTENCSYHMLGLLDVANENWNLSKRNPSIVIPVDTIKTLKETPNLIRRISYRPSKLKKAKQSIRRLNKSETELFKSVVSTFSASPLVKQTNATKAKVLDAAIEFLDYKYSKEVLLEKKETMKWKQELLIARSETGIVSNEEVINLPENERPDLGHGPRRLMISTGIDNLSGSYQTLSFRFALHDFYDPLTGQNPQATMEMGDLKLRYYKRNKLKSNSSKLILERFNLVNVVNLSPVKQFFTNLSWRFNLGTKVIQDSGCDHCLAPGFQYGAGLSYLSNFIKSYLFATTELDIHRELSKENIRLGIGPEMNFIISPLQNLNFGIFADYKWRFPAHVKKTYSYGSRLRYSFVKNLAVDLRYQKYTRNWNSELALAFYY